MEKEENKELYFLANYFYVYNDSPQNPYPPLDVNIVIEKDLLSNKFHYIDFGMEDIPWRIEDIYDTYEEAINKFYNHNISFYLFKIKNIKESKIFSYTKKLIERLNKEQYDKIEKIPLKSFKKYLGVELKLILKSKGVNIINIVKDRNTKNEKKSFFVGKLAIEGSMITIKNENDNIIFLTSSENITIETEEIKNEIYWYFKK